MHLPLAEEWETNMACSKCGVSQLVLVLGKITGREQMQKKKTSNTPS